MTLKETIYAQPLVLTCGHFLLERTFLKYLRLPQNHCYSPVVNNVIKQLLLTHAVLNVTNLVRNIKAILQCFCHLMQAVWVRTHLTDIGFGPMFSLVTDNSTTVMYGPERLLQDCQNWVNWLYQSVSLRSSEGSVQLTLKDISQIHCLAWG